MFGVSRRGAKGQRSQRARVFRNSWSPHSVSFALRLSASAVGVPSYTPLLLAVEDEADDFPATGVALEREEVGAAFFGGAFGKDPGDLSLHDLGVALDGHLQRLFRHGHGGALVGE